MPPFVDRTTHASPTVYLAGPITGLTYDSSTDWRRDAEIFLAEQGIRALSPLRGKDYLRDKGPLEDSYYDTPLSTGAAILARDRWDCTRADVVLVNLLGAERVSIGTIMEVAWADAVRTPIVLAVEDPLINDNIVRQNIHEHSMLMGCAGFRAPTLQQALDIVAAIV